MINRMNSSVFIKSLYPRIYYIGTSILMQEKPRNARVYPSTRLGSVAIVAQPTGQEPRPERPDAVVQRTSGGRARLFSSFHEPHYDVRNRHNEQRTQHHVNQQHVHRVY